MGTFTLFVLLLTYLGIGVLTMRYTGRVRVLLGIIAVLAPLLYFI